MRKFGLKTCLNCKEDYQPVGSSSKFCTIKCRNIFNKPKSRQQQQDYQRRKGRQVGIGSGGTTGSGKDNFMYKHGLGTLQNNRAKIKAEQRYCGHCEKDLLEATHYNWVIHHIDHNRYNNPEDGSNWILLCKRCHQIEHQCWKGYEGATTKVIRLSNGRYARDTSSSQAGSETPDTQASIAAGSDIV